MMRTAVARRWSILVLASALASLGGCGAGSSPARLPAPVTLTVRVASSTVGRAVADIVQINVTVTGVYMADMHAQVPFSASAGQVSTMLMVPAGDDRKFQLDAVDNSNTVLYTGSTTQSIRAGQSNSVAVDLYPPGGTSTAFLDVSTVNPPVSLKSAVTHLGVGFYGPTQSPDLLSQLTEAQVVQRLTQIKSVFPSCGAIRMWDTLNGHLFAVKHASDFGLKVNVGLWLSADTAANQQRIASLASLAPYWSSIESVSVGSEVLLRGDLPAGDASSHAGDGTLIGYIRQVRAAIPTSVAVTYDDTYAQIIAHPAVAAACDYLLVNIYPFWEGVAIDDAVAYLAQKYRAVRQAYPSQRVVVGETGWPVSGSTVGNAVPSTDNARRYLIGALQWSVAAGKTVDMYWFEAAEEPWKLASEHETWGLMDASGALRSCFADYLY